SYISMYSILSHGDQHTSSTSPNDHVVRIDERHSLERPLRLPGVEDMRSIELVGSPSGREAFLTDRLGRLRRLRVFWGRRCHHCSFAEVGPSARGISRWWGIRG